MSLRQSTARPLALPDRAVLCRSELCEALPSTVGGEICAVFDCEPKLDEAQLEALLGAEEEDDMVLL